MDGFLKTIDREGGALRGRPTREAAAEAVRTLIRWAGDDPRREGLADTPGRVVRAYAEREGIAYRVEEPQEPKRRTISYSDNFKFNRVGPWTH